MIIVKYRGGLGNQMFQYALQYVLSYMYETVEIKADIHHYNMFSEHNGLEINQVFQVDFPIASRQEVKSITNEYYPYPWMLKYVPKLCAMVARKQKIDKKLLQNHIKISCHNMYIEQIFQLDTKKDWYIDGLWQNMDYFKGYESSLQNIYAFQNKSRYTCEDIEIIEEIKNSSSVSIHVRRGDFVNSKFDVCDLSYYQAAMKRIEDDVEDILYYFFTDDIEYVNKLFSSITNKKCIAHAIENSIIDMEMMSMCKHHIISNSTFSFWGAFLDKTVDKIVIAPKYSIIKQSGPFDLSVPEGWIQI